ncbi:hypothetical protein ACFY12_20720 [Streptomyces sp. NPDC001339]|uniref:hypothetical protein n=1 Tax=Streptomyces sp. NPDC001339 TaxID=3364563 RepID=UPI00369D0B94
MKQQLNDRQFAVLQWVSQGCPDGVWQSSSYKISCQALQNRGLVKVTRRRGHWSAVLTEAGAQYLARSAPPVPTRHELPPSAQNNKSAPSPVRTGNDRTANQAAPTAPRMGKSATPSRKTVVDELLEELAEADGRIIKKPESGPNAVNWQGRISAARRSGKIPKTKELYGFRTPRGYEIHLDDIPTWRLADLDPITVPTRLTHPHPVIKALKSQPHPLGLTKSVQPRALRIIQALITATNAQGHTSEIGPTHGAPRPYRRRSAPPHFIITAQGQPVGFLFLQGQDRHEHIPTEQELARAKKYAWAGIRRYDYASSDRLRIILSGGQPHRADEWADIPDHPLEDQLPEIVQEVTLRGEAAARKRLAEQEAARQRRLDWEAAMHQARIEYAEAYRVGHLETQAEAWHRATRLAAYLDAARAHIETLPGGQARADAEAWLSWATTYLERLNPLATPPRLPDIPDATADDLKPFLHGWSPYGPHVH